MKDPKLLRTNLVAEKLGVEIRTLYRYLRKGLLEYYKPAGIIYVTEKEVNRFLRDRKRDQLQKIKTKKIRKGPRRMVRKAPEKTV